MNFNPERRIKVRPLNGFLYLLIVLTLMSCAHIKSGQYVQLRKGQSVDSLAKNYGVSKNLIQSFNKKKSFRPGDWVFVPMNRGILGSRINRSFAGSYYIGDGKFIWPVPGSRRVSSEFGRRWGRPHNGIDISAPGGSHILSSAAGVVIYSGSGLRGFGNMIVIRHEDNFYSIYAHNRRNYVRKNEKVVQGQVIGQVGNTGRSTGNHLHFEIRRGDKALNPLAFFKEARYKIIASK